MMITISYSRFVRVMIAASLLLLSLCLGTAAYAQSDLSGGAGEGVKRPAESAPRRRPRSSSQPKTSKRNAKVQPAAKVQPKVDLSKQVEAALELGNTARDSDPPRHADAERAYKLAMELDPEDARTHIGLGNTYFDQKRYPEAETAFRRAVQLDPEDSDAFVSLAYVSNAQERYEEAEKSALRALAIDANEYAAHVAIGWSKYRRKSYQESEAAYRRAIALSPKSPELYSDLSLVLIEQGRWRDTEPVLKQAVTLNPSDASMLAAYGVVLHKLGQLDRAAETYAQVSKLDPKLSAPHSNLALVHYTRGDFTKAREEWEAALRLSSPYPLDRAGLLLIDRKFSEAQSQLEQYTQGNATDEDGWLLLGDVRRMQGNTEGSRTAYARAAQLAPDYAQHQRPTIPAPVVALTLPKTETNTASTVSSNVGAGVKQTSIVNSSTEVSNTSSNAPSPRYASKVRNVSANNFAKATPATGAISVNCTPNSIILIEPLSGGEAQMSVVPASLTVVAFNQLRPGEYRIVAALDGYETVEMKVFVAVTRVVSVKLALRPKP